MIRRIYIEMKNTTEIFRIVSLADRLTTDYLHSGP